MRASNGTFTTLAVEAKRSLAPRDVDRLLPGVTRIVRELAGNIPILVVAPWLSARTQELLEAQDINFIDLTGNARVSLQNPALFISSEGAARNPEPLPRGQARVRGPKAARLVRLLADVRPPYGVGELAAAAKLTPGYVSRLLDTLDREGMIERSRKGAVESVDAPGLLRRWAESYDVLRTNEAQTFLAPNGTAQALEPLRGVESRDQLAVTGSFAAVRLAPVAAPALLLLYCEAPESIADSLGLLPADQGANVGLLRPFDPIVWARTSEDQGLRFVAAPQIAVDCLTGTGRMPNEGDALLKWMSEDESRWRLDSLANAGKAGNDA
ncbi:MAG: type IV toxin-antitoxin system AbiEi family antitoxin [Solirubrobacterales bacterium]